MRSLTILSGILLLGGCATWRVATNAELRSGSGEVKRVLLVTREGRALELDVGHSDNTRVYGKVVRAWRVPEKTNAGALTAHDERPGVLAKRLNWERQLGYKGGEPIEVPLSEISAARVYEPRTGRTVGAVVGGVLGVTALAVGLGLILVVTSIKCGRPLRVRGRRVVTRLSKASGWCAPVHLAPVSDDVRGVLAEIWREEAQAEHAAIAAFSKLSLELLALGAPPDLVVRANRAAIQEVEHARLCFAVASAYSGETLGPAPLPEALEGDTVDLFRVGREALLDGCLREGLAAEVARRGAERAKDPEVVRVIRVQAKEEAQHASLGWALVDWCIEQGGEPMRRTLLAALAGAAMPRCDDLPDHGHLGPAEVAPLFHELLDRARARLSACELAAAA